MFVVARDAGADRQVGTALDEQFADFRVDTFEVGQGVKDRSLSAHVVGVDVGAGVDISAAIEEEARGVEVTELSSDIDSQAREKRCRRLACIEARFCARDVKC